MNNKRIFALGFFDGVHIGHQALLKACCAMAKECSCTATALTFDIHPDSLVTGTAPVLINTAQDQQRLLESYGIREVMRLAFNEQTRTMSWQDYFQLLLGFGAGGVVCGDDFRFGYRAEGDVQKLQHACREAKIPCVVVSQQTVDGIRVTSTHIRTLLERGETETAVRFLGHPHILTGKVIRGQHLGRTLGTPTANIRRPKELLELCHGVYACRALFKGKWHLAVTNVGCRPTVNGTDVTIEPWLLDFDGNLYGRKLTLEFHKFLRPEIKFDSLEELQEQIRKDAANTVKFFKKT